MFPNVRKTKSRDGGYYEYLRILETCYENGEHKQHVVANFGRLDKIRADLPKLAKALARIGGQHLAAPNEVEADDALPWGHILLARHLYQELGMDEIIAKRCGSTRQKFDVAETAFVLIANRLSTPKSEHGLARWLENNYVCDKHGKRWRPEWLPEEEISKEQRVRVQQKQLSLWYRTLDALLRGKKEIEKDLYLRLRDLFNLKVDMVLYDVTNTYFSRRRPKGELRRHGESKEGRNRNVLVALGVVMANGWPIAHHVFPGNTTDKKTFQTIIEDIEKRFGLRRVLVVADRGMVSKENMDFLGADGREIRYLMGITDRRLKEAQAVLKGLKEEDWREVDKGNRVQEVKKGESSARYFVVESEERRVYEEELRRESMERARTELRKVEEAVAGGRLKDPKKIAARAARAFSNSKASRYYSYEVGDAGGFRFWEDEKKLAAEKMREGRYILKSDDPNIRAEESVGIYKQLSDVEWAYRDLKDIIEMRPIHHRSDPRVEAHIFVATIALFLKRTLEKHLREKGLPISPTEAFEAMQSMGVTVLDFDGEQKLLVSSGGRDARRLVKALNIKCVYPPKPTVEVQRGLKKAIR